MYYINFLFLGSLNVCEFFHRCEYFVLFCKGMLVGYFLLKSLHSAPLKSAIPNKEWLKFNKRMIYKLLHCRNICL